MKTLIDMTFSLLIIVKTNMEEKMKNLIYVLIFVLMMLSVPMVSLAATVEDFHLSYSAELSDEVLTVSVDINAPAAEEGKNSSVFSRFYINSISGIQLTKTEDSYSSSPLNASFGETCWIPSPSNQAQFCYVSTGVAQNAYAGGTQHFEIKFNVSDVDIKVGDTLIIGPSRTNRIATWNGSGVTVDEGTVLATCVITGSGSSSGNDSVLTASNFTAPTDTYFADAGITVTPSTSDLSFTVACNKACVTAKVNEDGTYTVLPATTKDGVHTYTAGTADDQFVVAVKGDANGDGETDAGDAAVASAFEVGNITLNSLQQLIADINLDGSVDSGDSAAAKAVDVGNLILNW